MRIILSLSKNTELVPTNYYSSISSAIHKWLGKNNKYHNTTSYYNFSFLNGGRKIDNYFDFRDGANIILSSIDEKFIIQLLKGINKNPEFNYGMKVIKFKIDNDFDKYIRTGENKFLSVSPILISSKNSDGKKEYVTFNHDNAGKIMTTNMIEKLKNIDDNINFNNFSIRFDDSPKAIKSRKTRWICIHGDYKYCSLSPIIITGDKKTVRLCLLLGIGKSNGIGFGCISNKFDEDRKIQS